MVMSSDLTVLQMDVCVRCTMSVGRSLSLTTSSPSRREGYEILMDQVRFQCRYTASWMGMSLVGLGYFQYSMSDKRFE